MIKNSPSTLPIISEELTKQGSVVEFDIDRKLNFRKYIDKSRKAHKSQFKNINLFNDEDTLLQRNE